MHHPVSLQKQSGYFPTWVDSSFLLKWNFFRKISTHVLSLIIISRKFAEVPWEVLDMKYIESVHVVKNDPLKGVTSFLHEFTTSDVLLHFPNAYIIRILQIPNVFLPRTSPSRQTNKKNDCWQITRWLKAINFRLFTTWIQLHCSKTQTFEISSFYFEKLGRQKLFK